MHEACIWAVCHKFSVRLSILRSIMLCSEVVALSEVCSSKLLQARKYFGSTRYRAHEQTTLVKQGKHRFSQTQTFAYQTFVYKAPAVGGRKHVLRQSLPMTNAERLSTKWEHFTVW